MHTISILVSYFGVKVASAPMHEPSSRADVVVTEITCLSIILSKCRDLLVVIKGSARLDMSRNS